MWRKSQIYRSFLSILFWRVKLIINCWPIPKVGNGRKCVLRSLKLMPISKQFPAVLDGLEEARQPEAKLLRCCRLILPLNDSFLFFQYTPPFLWILSTILPFIIHVQSWYTTIIKVFLRIWTNFYHCMYVYINIPFSDLLMYTHTYIHTNVDEH